ncbi:hypothetical protein GBAR_LOCUS27802 [Geodia barretti]|uniref:Uncharacterized protein n=1 Tax=Geodia barretti TaxID=519541 RepID=A0AA35XFP2_GEOBA|nr:hypothetical protein GBAR_LOCUS27802 [Geodia barretti]
MAIEVFPGLAQRIALVFIILTAIAWFLIVIGFGIGSEELENVEVGYGAGIFAFPMDANDRAEPPSYMYRMTIFSGVGAVVVGLLHAAFWKPFSMIFGAITAFFSVLFLSSLGMILYYNGNIIRVINSNYNNVEISAWFALEFVGAFLAILFWTAFFSVLFISSLGMILFYNGDLIRVINSNDNLDVDIPAWFALEFAGAFLAILFWTPVMMLWFFYDVDVTFRKA